MRLSLQHRIEASVAEHVARGVYSVHDAIREEDDQVARTSRERELFIFRVRKESEREAFRLNGLDLWPFGSHGDEERLNRAGIGDLQGLVRVVPNGEEHRHVLGVELAFLKLVVEGC